MTMDGICGRLKLIAATENDAKLSRIQASSYFAGEAEKDAIDMGIEERHTQMRYTLQRSGNSLQLINRMSLLGQPQVP